MAIITSYSDDTSTSDSDKFLTSDSAGATKLTPASNINKYLGPGWTIADDSWSFSSWNSTTKVGVINANSGANTKYQKGMWLRFTQPTLGTKHLKVTNTATSSITVTSYDATTLDNEAMSNPHFSTGFAPFGVNTEGTITPAEMNGVDLLSRGDGYTASPPTAGTGQFYMQAGSTIVTTNAGGDATITFPTAFPTGLLTVLATDGDDSGSTAVVSIVGTGTTRSSFNLSSPKVGTVRINWIAIGW